MTIEIIVRNDSIIKVDVDAIVNPANSFGFMGGGVAKAIKQIGGQDIEDTVISEAPIEIGNAVATTAGDLRCEAVIHAPTMRDPAQKTNVKCVQEAMEAALIKADEIGCRTLAIPGMGTGVGGVSKKESAKVMIKEIKRFKPQNLQKVILVDIDEEMVSEWKKLV